MSSKVLITQGTRPFAQRVAKQMLPAGSIVLFGSADEMPAVLLNTGNYLHITHPKTPAFAHEMLKICLDHVVDVLIPLGRDELFPLAEARQLFAEYGISIWLPDVADLAELTIIENPPRQLPLLLLRDGIPVTDTVNRQQYGSLSGIFSVSDEGDELALCCIAD